MMKSSDFWCHHFQKRLKNPWSLYLSENPNIAFFSNKKLIRSLQAWQKGETSDGAHLKSAVKRSRFFKEDPYYFKAIECFIKEEQHHGEMLGQYLDSVGVKRLASDMGDFCFRKVRYFMGHIEIWTVTVLIIENMAELYYGILARRSGCPVLKRLCENILADEVWHIRFQCERLALMWRGRAKILLYLTQLGMVSLNGVVMVAVWLLHLQVFKLDQLNFMESNRKSFKKLKYVFQFINHFMSV
ncbi:MAG: ferritin-like domain-containing protein [Verrucomicrobiae bacterium]|nr:ferritin-like domain-containing protein [Verrucomicrobiae bacterium]